MKLEAEGREFAKNLRSQLEFKLEKLLGFRNMQEKLEKCFLFVKYWITILQKLFDFFKGYETRICIKGTLCSKTQLTSSSIAMQYVVHDMRTQFLRMFI